MKNEKPAKFEKTNRNSLSKTLFTLHNKKQKYFSCQRKIFKKEENKFAEFDTIIFQVNVFFVRERKKFKVCCSLQRWNPIFLHLYIFY